MPFHLNKTARVLFIGDSITDCGRMQEPEHLGNGYVRLVSDWLRAKDPLRAPEVLNRGFSGNKITDLQNRWQTDVLDLSPDFVSIFIGINDVWHGLMPGLSGIGIEGYRAAYQRILEQTRSTLPQCQIVLCEPSVIWPPQDARANEMLKPYAKVVYEMARQHKARCVVPLHTAFERAKEQRPDIEWTSDGVHPTPTGHMLIARTWLDAMHLL